MKYSTWLFQGSEEVTFSQTTHEKQTAVYALFCGEKDSKALCDLISSLQEGTNPNTAPHPCRELFTELVHNSPVCGTFQNEEVIDSLRKIADGQFKTFLTPPITTS